MDLVLCPKAWFYLSATLLLTIEGRPRGGWPREGLPREGRPREGQGKAKGRPSRGQGKWEAKTKLKKAKPKKP